MSSSEEPQFSLFKDALAKRLVAKSDPDSSGSDDLDDFTSYLAAEVWSALPPDVREATYENRDKTPTADEVYLDNIPISFIDTLTSCGLAEDSDDAIAFLRKVVEEYIGDACAPPLTQGHEGTIPWTEGQYPEVCSQLDLDLVVWSYDSNSTLM